MPVTLDTETTATPFPVAFSLTVTAPGGYSYSVPAGSVDADITLWGAGGGGAGGGASFGGGGGGGGAQTTALAVATVPHTNVAGIVGTGGALGLFSLAGGDGSGSEFQTSAIAFADFGLGGEPGNGTQGAGGFRGAGAHCVPVGRNGGNGGGGDPALATGGGGGGSAGTAGVGGTGNADGTAGTAGAGAGAAGGTGALAGGATAAGSPGAGGGGASTLFASSAGANGKAVIVANSARWDAILTGTAPGQTFSIFVDTGAGPGIEVRNDQRYNGNTASWDALVGNLGVKVFGVKTELDVETAINAFAGLATVTTPGTTPTATFSDTPLDGIDAPFLSAATIDDAISQAAPAIARVSYINPPAKSLLTQMNLWIVGMFTEPGIFPPSLDARATPGQRAVTNWFGTHLMARDQIEGPAVGDAGVIGTEAVINAVVRVLSAVKFATINGDISATQQNLVIALYNTVWE